MKNIHLIPTDKPSRLLIDTIENKLYYQPILHNKTVNVLTQNIYITNDEEIKEGDWCLYLGLSMTWFKLIEIDDYKLYWGSREYFNKNLCKKIILTTDQDLIKDGVQKIDDEFLEWFVKNPSCEEVEVNEMCYGALNGFSDAGYKIIIPKENQKQHLIDIMKADEELGLYEEPKQETLEEAFHRISDSLDYSEFDFTSFRLGAKWQKERSYSEEEVNEIIAEAWNSCEDNEGETFTEVRKRIIEQFKKK